jgi:hypothetical protein
LSRPPFSKGGKSTQPIGRFYKNEKGRLERKLVLNPVEKKATNLAMVVNGNFVVPAIEFRTYKKGLCFF